MKGNIANLLLSFDFNIASKKGCLYFFVLVQSGYFEKYGTILNDGVNFITPLKQSI